jgi:hypothetical protein
MRGRYDGMGVGKNKPSERITLPDGLDPGSFEATGSDIRRVVPIDSVPWVLLGNDDLTAFPLDSRAGFVLSLIDGRSDVSTILDLASMDEEEVIDILSRLVRLGVVRLHAPDGRPLR